MPKQVLHGCVFHADAIIGQERDKLILPDSRTLSWVICRVLSTTTWNYRNMYTLGAKELHIRSITRHTV
jgi:hypothetical protein